MYDEIMLEVVTFQGLKDEQGLTNMLLEKEGGLRREGGRKRRRRKRRRRRRKRRRRRRRRRKGKNVMVLLTQKFFAGWEVERVRSEGMEEGR